MRSKAFKSIYRNYREITNYIVRNSTLPDDFKTIFVGDISPTHYI